ncbi:hypothetical protein [Rufibacter soli]
MNINYDNELLKIEGLTWLPFVGKDYDSTHSKILFVGESHYKDPKSNNENFKKKEFTRMIVDEMAICNYQYGSPFFNRISDLFNFSDRTELWNKTSFYNFIQRPMNKGEKVTQGVIERPLKVDFENSWNIFFDVINKTKPDYCIFFGNTAANTFNKACNKRTIEFKSIVWEDYINRSYLKKAEVSIESHKTEIIFIKHPSSYFTTNKWREVLLAKYPKLETTLK